MYFDHHPLFADLLSVEGAYITDGKFPYYISFFVYTFCRLLSFGLDLNMTFQDFHNIKSGENVTAELFQYGLFWKLSNFGFHRSQCKTQIIIQLRADKLFFKTYSFNHGVNSVLSFYAISAFQNCFL